jgi:HPt (histidine-containing phosphotransfer) domain-containing protein
MFDYADALNQVDQEVVEIIAAAFVAQWPVELSRMTQALEQDDWGSLTLTAHSLKGILGMFGAHPAVALARDLETLTSETNARGKEGVRQAVPGKLSELTAQVGLLMAALGQRGSEVLK